MAQSNEQGSELRALIEEKLSEYSIHPQETHEGACGFWGTEDGEGIDYCDCAQKFEVEQFNLCMPEIMQLILADRKQHELEAVKERLSKDIPFLEEMKHRLDNSQDNLVDYEGVMGMIDDWLAELKAERERLGK